MLFLHLNIYCYANDVYDVFNKYLNDFECENKAITKSIL